MYVFKLLFNLLLYSLRNIPNVNSVYWQGQYHSKALVMIIKTCTAIIFQNRIVLEIWAVLCFGRSYKKRGEGPHEIFWKKVEEVAKQMVIYSAKARFSYTASLSPICIDKYVYLLGVYFYQNYKYLVKKTEKYSKTYRCIYCDLTLLL